MTFLSAALLALQLTVAPGSSSSFIGGGPGGYYLIGGGGRGPVVPGVQYLANSAWYYNGTCTTSGALVGTSSPVLRRPSGGNATGWFNGVALSCGPTTYRNCDFGVQFDGGVIEVLRFPLTVGKVLATWGAYLEYRVMFGTGLLDTNAFYKGRGLLTINEGAASSNANSAYLYNEGGKLIFTTIDGSGAKRTVECTPPAELANVYQFHGIRVDSSPTAQTITFDGTLCGSITTGTGTGEITVQAAPANNLSIGARTDPDTLTSSAYGTYRRVVAWDGATQAPADLSIFRYAAVGDSITSGNSTTTRMPYPAAASREYGPNKAMDNWGVWGTRTDSMLTRWRTYVQNKGYNGLVFLGGVNDIIADVPLASIQSNIGTLLAEAKAEGVPVVPMTLTPWKNHASWTLARQTNTELLNEWITTTAIANDYRLVDAYTLLSDPTELGSLAPVYNNTGDHLHPNTVGEAALWDAIQPALEQSCTTYRAATNYVLRSQEFQVGVSGPWTQTGATGVADQVVAPDGTMTGDALDEGTAGGQHRVSRATTVPAGTATFSVYLKPGGRGYALLRIGANGAYIDVTNCAPGSITGTATVGTQAAKNGWCRAWVTAATAGNDSVFVNIASGPVTNSYTGTSQVLYVWGAQLESGSAATPYIATTTATVARPLGCYPNTLMAGADLFRLDIRLAADGLDSSLQRVPAITKVRDGRLLAIWEQIRKPVASDGQGVRLVQAFVDYDLVRGTVSVGPITVFEEPASWSSNLGAAMHPMLTTLTSGRIVAVYNVNDEASGTVENRILNAYRRYSDDGGVTWSAKTLIVSATNWPPGAADYAASTGTTGGLTVISSGLYAGRIVAPIYGYQNARAAIYSDDDGITWTEGAPFSTPGYSANEWGMAWRSDGTLLAHLRTEGSYQLIWATSANGGADWTFQGARPDWRSSNCASSMESAARVGGQNLFLWSGLDNATNYLREGLVLRLSADAVSWDTQYRPIESNRDAGYSQVLMLSPTAFAVIWENGFNAVSNMMLYITTIPEAQRVGQPRST